MRTGSWSLPCCLTKGSHCVRQCGYTEDIWTTWQRSPGFLRVCCKYPRRRRSTLLKSDWRWAWSPCAVKKWALSEGFKRRQISARFLFGRGPQPTFCGVTRKASSWKLCTCNARPCWQAVWYNFRSIPSFCWLEALCGPFCPAWTILHLPSTRHVTSLNEHEQVFCGMRPSLNMAA